MTEKHSDFELRDQRLLSNDFEFGEALSGIFSSRKNLLIKKKDVDQPLVSPMRARNDSEDVELGFHIIKNNKRHWYEEEDD